MKFQLGKTVQTQGIAHESKDDPIFARNIQAIFTRYINGDWGDLCDDDKKMNDDAVATGDDRILASYLVPTATAETKKVYIITEYDRSVTTVLFADEY
ncbi:hypothetical protein EBZ39_08730 [bacterium]|nr:hypothetical protein [bacterium]